MRAIIFDFFGTLTDPAAEAERRPTFAATASALGVPAEPFWAAMSGSFPERITGTHGGTRATLLEMARRCGAHPSERQLDAAVAAQRSGAERVRRPRPGVLDVLAGLRAVGFRLAVLSDCSSELCEDWPGTPFASRLDAAVFSWQEGYRKPDARLYATAAARLGVPASECWFVGDGGSREHQGAHAAGMRPVLVSNAGFPGATAFRDDPDTFVPDLVVDDVTEVPGLVGAAAPGASYTPLNQVQKRRRPWGRRGAVGASRYGDGGRDGRHCSPAGGAPVSDDPLDGSSSVPLDGR